MGEEEGGRIWESSIETYTPPYVKQVASGKLLYDSGNPNLVFNNLEGWEGEGGGREVQEGGDLCTPVANPPGYMAEINTIL